MKLTKVLTIAGEKIELNSDEVQLDLVSPGRAVFTVVSDKPLSGIVQFSTGYNPQNLQLFFTGIVINCFQVNKKQHSVFCRELSASLNQMLPVSLRNITLNEVLADIAKKTGLQFVTPDQPYSKTKAPAFYSVGGGYHCMDSLARVFRIPKMIWQQQGDGKIYVGSWDHSYWANKPIELPVELQTTSGISNSAQIPAVPHFRPGVCFTNGSVINSVNLTDAHMKITWEKNMWGNEWINKSTVR